MSGESRKRLIQAFFGKGKGSLGENRSAMEQMTQPAGKIPLRVMIESLLELKEEDWFSYAWSREPLEEKFTWEQKMEYGLRAAECGRCEAELLLAETGAGRHGGSGGMEERKFDGPDVWKLARDLNLKVTKNQTDGGGEHVIFAQYQEPDAITIYMDGADQARALIEEENLGELLGHRAVEDVLLSHELFHVMEYRKRDAIYTQTEKVELWKKPFSNRSRIMCLGEIAGMEFARRLTCLTYTPYVLDVLMMYGYDRGAAAALYEEIRALAG